MDVMWKRCAGLDVHQEEIAACVRVTPEDGRPWTQSRRFSTTPAGLVELRDWLASYEVSHVAMEATGVYWMPVYEVLEGAGLDLTLCNAHHVKNVPGRKTDQSDAAWLAQLLASGLLKKSFVPPAEVRAVRELTRARVHLIEDRTRTVNVLHRLFERAGLKLCSVVSDLQGMTARAIMRAIADGEADPVRLAKLARGSLRGKRAQLEAVLTVKLSDSERKVLSLALERLTLCDTHIADLEGEISRAVAPWRAQIDRAMTLPGIDEISAVSVLAEIGPDVAAFDDAHRLAAWAGLAPGQRESAGKRKRTGTRDGNAYIRRVLVQAAMAISRSNRNPSDLTEYFRKKLPALGYKKAVVAVAHKLIQRLWVLLRRNIDYAPPAPKPPTERQRARRIARALSTLEQLGVHVDRSTLGLPVVAGG